MNSIYTDIEAVAPVARTRLSGQNQDQQVLEVRRILKEKEEMNSVNTEIESLAPVAQTRIHQDQDPDVVVAPVAHNRVSVVTQGTYIYTVLVTMVIDWENLSTRVTDHTDQEVGEEEGERTIQARDHTDPQVDITIQGTHHSGQEADRIDGIITTQVTI